jgi:YD repeat-containing protein
MLFVNQASQAVGRVPPDYSVVYCDWLQRYCGRTPKESAQAYVDIMVRQSDASLAASNVEEWGIPSGDLSCWQEWDKTWTCSGVMYQIWYIGSFNPPGSPPTAGSTVDLRSGGINEIRKLFCPANSDPVDGVPTSCQCKVGFMSSSGACIPYADKYINQRNTCAVSFGNPLLPLTGTKEVTVDIGASWFPLIFTYNTTYVTETYSGSPGAEFLDGSMGLGRMWSSRFSRRLVFQLPDAVGVAERVQILRGKAGWLTFTRDSGRGLYLQGGDLSGRLVRTQNGWLYSDEKTGEIERYDEVGRIQSISLSSGAHFQFSYSDGTANGWYAEKHGFPSAIRNQFGKYIGFNYDSSGQLVALKSGGAVSASLKYVNGNLTQILWPNGTSRRYGYDHPALPWALTGVFDENDALTAIYEYDAGGRAVATQSGVGANRYSVSWQTAPYWSVSEQLAPDGRKGYRTYSWLAPSGTEVTLPSGGKTILGSTLIGGGSNLTGQTQPAGAGCAAASKSISYDANGNVAREDDFNGSRTCRVHDLSRNLESSRVEGLSSTAVCSTVLASGASLPAGSRKTSSQWHPDWRLSVKTAEPGRLVTSVYNGQPDPFNGGAVASCAPSSALLPDGKPIVVLCKQVEQAITDANGALGFGAPLQSGVLPRVQQYSYNQYGQVLTAKDPLNNVTSYVYYSDTTGEHTKGDLQSVTNALGHVTQFTHYNPAGQVLRQLDANNIATDYTYDLRQRLTSVTASNQTTQYVYWPTGLLKQVIQPDQSFVAYDYDDAHRLVALSDSRGNRIDYTLDNMGNRTAEAVKDPSGILSRQLSRTMDTLGRIQIISGERR